MASKRKQTPTQVSLAFLSCNTGWYPVPAEPAHPPPSSRPTQPCGGVGTQLNDPKPKTFPSGRLTGHLQQTMLCHVSGQNVHAVCRHRHHTACRARRPRLTWLRTSCFCLTGTMEGRKREKCEGGGREEGFS